MDKAKQYHRELRFEPISKFHTDNKYNVYSELEERKDLVRSVSKSGIEQALIAFEREGKLIVIDGKERLKTARALYGNDYKVPVWVILDELTDEEIFWLILTYERKRHKTYVDLVNEYKLYDKLIPSQQGSKNVEITKSELISDLMGKSKSQLHKLLKIDRIKPSLLHAVDNDLITLEGARRKADEIARKQKLEMELSQDSVEDDTVQIKRNFRDTIISLDELPHQCEFCSRPFDTIRYEDIPAMFNINRDDEDDETEWLQEVA